jgi:hypothetical protein
MHLLEKPFPGGKKMIKRVLFISFVILTLSVSAFAGEGSDTIGACKLMPELRYAYYETPVNITSHPWSVTPTLYGDDWKVKEHNVTVQVNYGVTDYFDVFAFVGARIAAEKSGSALVLFAGIPPSYQKDVFDLGTGFMGGVGVKGTFYRASNGLYVGGGASFLYSFTNDTVHFRSYIDDVLNEDSGDAGVLYRETDMAATADLHVGWHIGNTGLTPYLGVEYRWDREDFTAKKFGYDNHINNYTTDSKHPVGVYVGLDYTPNNRLYVNLEGQMIKRWGGSFSVGHKFDLCGKPPYVAPTPVPAPPIEPKLEPMSLK